MDFAIALYDALAAVDVPADKARRVVDSLKRDMEAVLATKQDLAYAEQGLRGEIARVEQALRAEIARVELTLRDEIERVEQSLRSEIERVEQTLRGEIERVEQTLRGEIGRLEITLRGEIERQALRTTVVLGSIVVATAGLTLAAAALIFR